MKWTFRKNHIWGVILSLLLLFLVLSLPDFFLDTEEVSPISQVSSLGISKEDMEKMSSYYIKTFGCKKIQDLIASSQHLTKIFGGREVRIVVLELGSHPITLVQDLNRQSALPHSSGQQITLLVKSIDQAEVRLKELDPHMVIKRSTFEKGKNKELIHLIFFQDPEGNFFQLQEKKSVKKSPLFFDVSHISFLVDDLEKSSLFYHEILGLEIEEQGIYQGPYPWHQTWVNEKFQTRAFTAKKGPKIELIKASSSQYFSPPLAGRMWSFQLVSSKMHLIKNLLKVYGQGSFQIVNTQPSKIEFKQAMVIKDPYGYPLLLVKP